MKSKVLLATRPIIVVAAAIIQQREAILLSKRKPGSDLGGLWEFPGGKKEAGESLVECVCREVKEELDVEISEPQPFYSIRYQYPDKEVKLHFFMCTITRGSPQSLGCAEIAWVHKNELFSFEFPPADIPVLEKLRRAGTLEGQDFKFVVAPHR